ncbi:DUF2062 domain-containing protein [Candidatus Woesearchaeota archaeon]|nr:DUF2062 domain-containing protein [Candidatus Woesearchaeota archaeon]
MSLSDLAKKHFKALLETKRTPNSIAVGFAIGTFIAVLPTPGFNILIGLLIVLLFEKISKYALFIAMAVWNPLTVAPFYFLSYKVGSMLDSVIPNFKFGILIVDRAYDYSSRFLVGNFIVAFTLGLTCYLIVYFYLKNHPLFIDPVREITIKLRK